MYFHVKFILLLLFGCFIFQINSENCSGPEGHSLQCPGDDSPSHFTKCCWSNNQTMSCCPISLSDQDMANESFVMIVSIFVILLCLTLSVFFVVCCFWSPCPLYSVCRMNYTYGDIVAYSKEEEATTLPPETCGKTHYTPLHVKMKQVDEV